MSVDEDILKELKWQNTVLKAQLITLTEIKFELQNNHRKSSESTYTIPLPKKKGILEKLREKIMRVISKGYTLEKR